MESELPDPKDLGLEQHTFTFQGPTTEGTTPAALTVWTRKTLDETLRFKITMQCDVDELFESLRDFGGGFVPELFTSDNNSKVSSEPPATATDNDTTPSNNTNDNNIKPEFAPDHLGLDVWPAAIEMCTYLAQHPELVTGVDVIELGAGVGLPGLLAAKLGAHKSLLTDYENSVVAFSDKNAALNNVQHNCSAFTLDWTKLDELGPEHCNAYQVVLAADVLYVEELMPWFVQAAITLMSKPNGILLVGHQSRRALIIDPETNTPEVHDRDVAFERFQKLCDDAGLSIRILGSRESEGFPGPFYMFAASRKEEASVLEALPIAEWPTVS